MAQNSPIDGQARTVCNQADVLLDTLFRTSGLPAPLSLSIEELLENAWEIAYRKSPENAQPNVIAFTPKVRNT
ncbi:hypothetical protein [Pelagibacterium lentulum]|uniref:Uncharacterized protein n=1 Tax=Pelagibacterium lentulum TaxID=2029865 RepID=A0A916REC6_9HYPH|nr:hypothetical protein [Pelagibacterium lentulum]GGA52936.1 hypothetical protein GCM10011499_23820 [Pelagibacterium lentulum]